MMPELGKYAAEVLGAYVVAILLLLVLVGSSVLRAAKMRRQLQDYEEQQRKNG